MGKVIIQEFTTKTPIQMIGYEAGVCRGADVSNPEENKKRGMNCILQNHGRTFEFPDIYMELNGYSARVIREWYTHIGGSPTRLQESTRYGAATSNYDFNYVIPPSIKANEEDRKYYEDTMNVIKEAIRELEKNGIPREDATMLLPLGMQTKIVCKHNFRNIMDMSRQRECKKAYWEYQVIMRDLKSELDKYSEEWKTLNSILLHPKCAELHRCPEMKPCGKMIKSS